MILASRDHTCINPKVETKPNKNELCRDLILYGAMKVIEQIYKLIYTLWFFHCSNQLNLKMNVFEIS